jgi:hypothetical protein
MFNYRITKYNPINRNSKGYYTLDEWTSFSDIEDSKYNLTLESYLKAENAYLESIKIIAEFNKATNFVFKNVENTTNFQVPKESENLDKILEIATKCLREELWCKIISPYKLFIHFGYDYYMYIGSRKELPTEIISEIEKLGLFAELIDKSPYL